MKKGIQILILVFFFATLGNGQKIIILPFANLSTVDKLEWLSYGISEGIYTNIKNTKELEFVDKTTSYDEYENAVEKLGRFLKNEDASEIGKRLMVDFVLYGYYSPIGEKINIYPKLIDIKQLKTVYNTGFSTTTTALPVFFKRIAVDVSNILEVAIEKEAISPAPRMSAYEVFIKGFYFHLGIHEKKDLNKAISYYLKSLELDKNNFYAYYNLGNAYLEKMKYNEALKNYQKALAINPKDGDALNNLGIVYLENSDFANGKKYFNMALASVGDDPQILLNLGNLYYKMQDYNTSEKYLQKVFYIDPQNFEVYYRMALIYLMTKRNEECIKTILAFPGKVPEQYLASYYLLLADAYKNVGKLDAAAGFIEKAITFKPKKIENFLLLGKISLLQQNMNKARYAFSNVIVQDSLNIEAHYYLAEVYNASDNPKKALIHYQKVMNLAAEQPFDQMHTVYHNVGKLYYAKSLYDNAEKYLKDAHNLVPRDPIILRDLALFYYKTDKDSKAVHYYERLLQIEPHDIEAYYVLGALALHADKNQDAVKYFRSGIDIASSDGNLHYFLGIGYTKINEFNWAIIVLKKAIALGVSNSEMLYGTYFNLGVCYEYDEKGERFGAGFNFHSAIEYFEKALKIKPSSKDAAENLEYLYRLKGEEKKIEVAKEEITKIDLPELKLKVIFDDSSGNDDGILNESEKAFLLLIIENTGDGAAKSLSAKLIFEDKPDGVVVEQLAYTIAAISPRSFYELKIPVKASEDIESGIATGEVTVREPYFNADAGPISFTFQTLKTVSEKTIPVVDSLRVDIDVCIPEGLDRRPKAIAVIIGNRDYVNQDVAQNEYALRDADLFKEYLVETFNYRRENIIFLQNATKAKLEQVFGSWGSPKGQLYNWVFPNESEVFIYYAGHGAPDIESKDPFILPVDVDPNYVELSGYSLRLLYGNLSQIPSPKIVVVIDACFCGLSHAGPLIAKASPLIISTTPPEIQSPKIIAFSAASTNEIASWYTKKRHGLFSYFFLKGLAGASDENRDNNITLGELKKYLSDNVSYWSQRLYNRRQTPTFKGDESMVILRLK